jgi:hypothetical protein
VIESKLFTIISLLFLAAFLIRFVTHPIDLHRILGNPSVQQNKIWKHRIGGVIPQRLPKCSGLRT